MLEKYIGLKTEKAYQQLKSILVKNDCTIVSEDPPKHILAKQGSLRGISPKSAKKEIRYDLLPDGIGTKIKSCSSISSDWARLTLWGSVMAGILAAVFWWIASDIGTLLEYGTTGYWTWLSRAFGYPNIPYVVFMLNVTRALSIVLAITIIFEIIDGFLVHHKIDAFAAEILDELAQK